MKFTKLAFVLVTIFASQSLWPAVTEFPKQKSDATPNFTSLFKHLGINENTINWDALQDRYKTLDALSLEKRLDFIAEEILSAESKRGRDSVIPKTIETKIQELLPSTLDEATKAWLSRYSLKRTIIHKLNLRMSLERSKNQALDATVFVELLKKRNLYCSPLSCETCGSAAFHHGRNAAVHPSCLLGIRCDFPTTAFVKYHEGLRLMITFYYLNFTGREFDLPSVEQLAVDAQNHINTCISSLLSAANYCAST